MVEFDYILGKFRKKDSGGLIPSNNLSDLTSPSTARTNLGLGTMATQNANAVAITGGSISGLSSPLAIADGGTNNALAYTAGSLIFSNGSKLTQDNANLFWDAANKRLGIGTATPAEMLHLYLSAGNYATMRFDSGNTQGFFYADDAFGFIVAGSKSNTYLSLVQGTHERIGFDTSGNIIVTGATQLVNKISKYNNIATAGWGVPSIYGQGRATGQTAVAASIATYTVGASDGSFLVSANVLVTASTTHSITVTVTYTDEGNTSRTLTLSFSQITGTILTAITNVQGVGAYEGVPLHIRAKAATAITIQTAGTFTSITYNVEAVITQIA